MILIELGSSNNEAQRLRLKFRRVGSDAGDPPQAEHRSGELLPKLFRVSF